VEFETATSAIVDFAFANCAVDANNNIYISYVAKPSPYYLRVSRRDISTGVWTDTSLAVADYNNEPTLSVQGLNVFAIYQSRTAAKIYYFKCTNGVWGSRQTLFSDVDSFGSDNGVSAFPSAVDNEIGIATTSRYSPYKIKFGILYP